MESQIWTIGHSNMQLAEFVELLQANEIRLLADVRRFPGSRKYPHFNKESLEKELPESGIHYQHFPELGGRRNPLKDSQNTIWRNKAFQGYADYMHTESFHKGLNELLLASSSQPTAMMCSEVLWWRCHRSLISDLLKAKGIGVYHIMSIGKLQEHPYTSAAKIIEGLLRYQ